VGRIDTRKLLDLTELQMNQAAKRPKFYGVHETDEIAAIKKLAYEMFGSLGMLEVERTGMIYVGHWHPEDMHIPISTSRRRRIFLQGNKHSEMQLQARLLGFNV
jgi:hypothetical protein